MRLAAATIAALIVLTIAAVGGPVPLPPRAVSSDAAPPESFVRVRGNQLVRDGQPFHFVGANLAIMHGPENRAAAEDVLVGAARDGIRVARIWALGEGDADAAPWLREYFLFRAGPDGWIDAAALHLDRVVAAAGRSGIQLIVTLANSWGDYGGVPRYLRWAGAWRDGVYGSSDRFYSDPRARAAYRAHVLRLLERTNHVTGVRYRDDPTIMAWELMNESSVATTAGAKARRAWIIEMARLIHSTDPHHLVTPGVGGYRVERERADWLAICRLPGVDYCDGHIYPEEMLSTREASTLDAALDEFVRLAQGIAGKPFVLGEFGFHGDSRGLWRGEPRAFWSARVLERLRFDGAAGGLVWIYQRAGGADRVHGISVDVAGADPTADALRAALGGAAAKLATDAGGPPPGGFNPTVAAATSTAALMPLHAEFVGQNVSVPVVRTDDARRGSATIAWEPSAYARADWETSGVYAGGALEHAWGGETGWFEYEYQVEEAQAVMIVPTPRGPAVLATPAGIATRAAARSPVSARVRISSEYPGSLSPTDGVSEFEIFLDGARLGRAVAPPDDGKGRWVIVRAARAASTRGALEPGRHRLRFAVTSGPRAHGLAIYGRPGEKPVTGVDAGPIQLRVGPVVRTKQ